MTTSLSVFFGKDKNQVFFFSGDQYIRFNKAAGMAYDGYPKRIKGKWAGLTFDSIDAVTDWRDGKAYFFSGNQYILYDLKSDSAVKGYPKQINSDNWQGLPFDSVDAVVKWDDRKAYFFKGDQYVRYDMKKDCVDEGYPKQFNAGNWSGMPFDSVDAVIRWDDETAYFFKDGQFVRFDVKQDRVADLPLPFAGPWPNVAFDSVDAVVNWGNGFAYFFKGDQYTRFNIDNDWVQDGPKKIADGWKGITFDSLDAVAKWDNGYAYFFKGDRYIRYNTTTERADPDHPMKIKDNWRGLTFDSVDAVVNWGNGYAYFFKGDEYTRYDIANDRPDKGYPLKIKGNWRGLDFNSIDAIARWDDSTAYIFKGDRYVRFLVKEDEVARGPHPVNAVTWPGVTWGRKQYDWMGEIPGIEGRKLFELTLPATHDSGSYRFTKDISPDNDLNSWIVKLKNAGDAMANLPGAHLLFKELGITISEFIVSLIEDFSRTQNRSVAEQLAYGIRSLDMRVCSFAGGLHTFHGLIAVPALTFLDDIKAFLQVAKREVLLVTASHMKTLSAEDHQKFLSMIKETLGDYLYPYDSSKSIGDTTVGEIVRGPSGVTSRVVFFYDSPGPDEKHPEKIILLRPPVPWVWPYEGIFSDYANMSYLPCVWGDQQDKLDQHPATPQQMFELNWTLTAQNDEAQGETIRRLKTLLGNVGIAYKLIAEEVLKLVAKKLGNEKAPYYSTLEQLTRQANATLWDFAAKNSDKKINSLNVDFFEDARVVELAIEMCRRACGKQAAVAAAATVATVPAAEEAREPIRV